MSSDLNKYKNYQHDIFTLRPFKDLKKKINKKRKREILAVFNKQKTKDIEKLDEQDLFIRAMEGVVPLKQQKGRGIKAVFSKSSPNILSIQAIEVDEEIGVRELCELVRGKIPIDVSSTPEYMSGGENCLATALSQGLFSIQAYLDLHGLDRTSAILECEIFFKEVILESKRCVGIIHGRGLSSKSEPVLKTAVYEWLKRGPFRKRILAFSSAPYWDGGAGVTYVLLKSLK